MALGRYARVILLSSIVAGLLLWLGWQRLVPFNLAIGGDLVIGESGEQFALMYDQPYLTNVHAPEPATVDLSTTETYRWTQPAATIDVPYLNGSAQLVRLSLAPPSVPQTPFLLTANGAEVRTDLPPGQRTLHMFAPASADGGLRLELQAPTYNASPDPRLLGVVLYRMQVQPLSHTWFMPWAGWLDLLMLVVVVGLGAALAGLAPLTAAGAMLVTSSGLGVLLATVRTIITLDTGQLRTISLGCLLVVGLGRWLAERRQNPEIALVAGMTALGLALRLIGIRHPQTNFSDLLLNVNNLASTSSGDLLFTEGLPCAAGAGRSPYPPGTYLITQPLSVLLPASFNRGILIQVVGAFADAMVIPLLWWLVDRTRDARTPARAALWAASLYLAPLAMLRAMVIGEWSNVLGQALALPVVAWLGLWLASNQPRAWQPALIAGLTVAALQHSGTMLSLGLWGVALAGFLAWQRQWSVLGRLVVIGTSAVVLAVGLYYSNFLGDPTLANNGVICPAPRPLGQKLWGVVWNDLIALDGRVPAWFWLVGLGGAFSLRHGLACLATPIWAWLATFVLSLSSLIWSEQTVRWWLFILPALALSGGVGLATLAQRGRFGRASAIAASLFIIAASLVLWTDFIIEYRTGAFVP
ncbi:hypothetical protein [Herpetosiphon llansteffanensis]|uniref:hypothetical protein n=1 Tax=Herpetosiphon llansteffanensis TaxID=2094568 RepID=UPI000D7C4A10|nr:hypothetical protein [Herpetosiphon llansteffanensis]